MVLAACLCVSLTFNYRYAIHECVITSSVDTVTVTDTISIFKPVAKDSAVIRYEKIYIPVTVNVVDTVTDTITNNVLVEIPISQKEYGDSAYHAWVSGYHASLDSIKVFSKTTTITQRYSVPVAKKWNIGPQVGFGYAAGKWSPYFGVGIQYSIFSW